VNLCSIMRPGKSVAQSLTERASRKTNEVVTIQCSRQLAHGAQSFSNGRLARCGAHLLRALKAMLDLSIEVTLVIVVICERSMNLPEREMRMLEMNLLGAPAMAGLIQRNLDHFCCSVVDPRNAAVIEADMSVAYRWHAGILYRSSPLDSIWFPGQVLDKQIEVVNE
jgi:hypothetical protein